MPSRLPEPTRKELTALLKEKGMGVWVELTRRYGKTFRASGMVMTCEPAAVRAVLMERPHTEKRPFAHRLMAMLPGSDGVLFMDGEPWLKRARALAAPFHRQTVDSHAGMVHATAVAHSNQWSASGGQADLYKAVQLLGAATVLKMGYGLDPADPVAARLGAALVANKNRIMTPDDRDRIDTLVPRRDLPIKLLEAYAKLWWWYRPVVKAVRDVLAAERAKTDRPNWIDRLVEAGLSARDLAQEVNHMYMAYNAIDYVTTAALCELAANPAMARAMRDELASALGAREVPTRDDLPRLPLTNAFTLEVLRCHVVSMGIVRHLGEPLELAGEQLPAGTQLCILLHALHHHPDYWDQPELFKPERWIDSPSPRVPYSYVPFLLGARKCMGRDMAEQQLLLVMAAIIRRFDIQIHAEPAVPPFMIPRFAAPIPFTLTPATAG